MAEIQEGNNKKGSNTSLLPKPKWMGRARRTSNGIGTSSYQPDVEPQATTANEQKAINNPRWRAQNLYTNNLPLTPGMNINPTIYKGGQALTPPPAAPQTGMNFRTPTIYKGATPITPPVWSPYVPPTLPTALHAGGGHAIRQIRDPNRPQYHLGQGPFYPDDPTLGTIKIAKGAGIMPPTEEELPVDTGGGGGGGGGGFRRRGGGGQRGPQWASNDSGYTPYTRLPSWLLYSWNFKGR